MPEHRQPNLADFTAAFQAALNTFRDAVAPVLATTIDALKERHAMSTTASTSTAEFVQQVADMAAEPLEPIVFDEGTVHEYTAIPVPTGRGAWDLRLYKTGLRPNEQSQPLRKAGLRTAHDVPSFLSLLEKHATVRAEVYADDTRHVHFLTAITDGGGHELDDQPRPAWMDHRIDLPMPLDNDWLAWTAIDGGFLDQQAFADHLETYRHTILDPDAAEVIEMAQNLEVTAHSRLRFTNRTRDGHRNFVVEGDTTSRAGNRGELTIPDEITLGIRPYRDATARPITARFRYRLAEEGLRLGVKLLQAEDHRRAAWADIVGSVAAQIAAWPDDPRAEGIRVVIGNPPHPQEYSTER